MAEWDRDWREKRDREEEKEREWEAAKRLKQGNNGTPGGPAGGGIGGRGAAGDINLDPASAKFDELIDRAVPLIEQLNNLYNMFFAGAEKRPPIERRKVLDQVIDTLTKIGKNTAAQRFKYQGVYQQYVTYRDRWDKKLKELEEGKIRRGA
ncbi:MAG TPA: hypothetical protein VL588_02915 [Bdellovibrionota bacterium]|nr:hypothetical protein [Bdellovibrionota bacterium]